MQESRLARKIGICSRVQCIPENECNKVLDLIRHELGCHSQRDFINKIILNNGELFTNRALHNLNQRLIELKTLKMKKNDNNDNRVCNRCNVSNVPNVPNVPNTSNGSNGCNIPTLPIEATERSHTTSGTTCGTGDIEIDSQMSCISSVSCTASNASNSSNSSNCAASVSTQLARMQMNVPHSPSCSSRNTAMVECEDARVTTDDELDPLTHASNSFFPLLRLPSDLISAIGHFLSYDNKELQHFERSNRLLFQLCNRASFLREYSERTKRRLVLNNRNLRHIVRHGSDLFKFSFAWELVLDFDCCVADYYNNSFNAGDVYQAVGDISYKVFREFVHDLRHSLNLVIDRCRSSPFHTPWFESLLHSIRVLNIENESLMLFDLLPTHALFDSEKSCLETISFAPFAEFCCIDTNYLCDPVAAFNENYNNFGKAQKCSSTLSSGLAGTRDDGSDACTKDVCRASEVSGASGTSKMSGNVRLDAVRPKVFKWLKYDQIVNPKNDPINFQCNFTHLFLNCVEDVELHKNKNIFHKNLKQLTIRGMFDFAAPGDGTDATLQDVHNNDLDEMNNNINNNNNNNVMMAGERDGKEGAADGKKKENENNENETNIETLRIEYLRGGDQWLSDLLDNEIVLKMNLNKSLLNVIMWFQSYQESEYGSIKQALDALFSKKYCHNLERLIVLFDVRVGREEMEAMEEGGARMNHDSSRREEKLLKMVFDLLLKQVDVLDVKKSGQFSEVVIAFGFCYGSQRVQNAVIIDCKSGPQNGVVNESFFYEKYGKCSSILNDLQHDASAVGSVCGSVDSVCGSWRGTGTGSGQDIVRAVSGTRALTGALTSALHVSHGMNGVNGVSGMSGMSAGFGSACTEMRNENNVINDAVFERSLQTRNAVALYENLRQRWAN